MTDQDQEQPQQPAKEPHKVRTITAFIVTEADGTEGITAFINNGRWVPMIGSDEERVESLKPIAKKISAAIGKPVQMVRFTVREDVEVIDGRH